MSYRNAYRVYCMSDDSRVSNRVEKKLNAVFNGHVEVTEYGFYAEDSPVAGETFIDNPVGYVFPRDLEKELAVPLYANDEWDEYQADLDEFEGFDTVFGDSPLYSEVIEAIWYECTDDTTDEMSERRVDFC